MGLPRQVKLVEVGPRDGLQSEKVVLSPPQRIKLIKGLMASGFSHIEAGSFVSDQWIPQLAQSEAVLRAFRREKTVQLSALVPNVTGLQRAIQAQVREIAVFVACSESFSKKNLNCSIQQSLERYQAVIKQAQRHKIKVRGYLSCVFGCPFEGDVPMARVKRLAHLLFSSGCYEISLGDTIGMGTIRHTHRLIRALSDRIPIKALALHFHDTRGQALANIYAALQAGVKVFDCSVGGVGGCPYAKSPTGNVASEDLLFMLHHLGIKTGVDLERVIQVNRMLTKLLQHPLHAKIAQVKTRR